MITDDLLSDEVRVARRDGKADAEIIDGLTRQGFSADAIEGAMGTARKAPNRRYAYIREKFLVQPEILNLKTYVALVISIVGVPLLLYAQFTYEPDPEMPWRAVRTRISSA
ncbi:MAG TPA: hypothetical protein VEL07_21350 [Planctomycetota bacterium]|nr:hypothetical protein [Planctomycetota bacterium]